MVIQTFSKPKISKPFKVRKFQHKIFQTPKIFQSLKTSKPDNFKVKKNQIPKMPKTKNFKSENPKTFQGPKFQSPKILNI